MSDEGKCSKLPTTKKGMFFDSPDFRKCLYYNYNAFQVGMNIIVIDNEDLGQEKCSMFKHI